MQAHSNTLLHMIDTAIIYHFLLNTLCTCLMTDLEVAAILSYECSMLYLGKKYLVKIILSKKRDMVLLIKTETFKHFPEC